MPASKRFALFAAVATALAVSSAAQAGPNVAVCVTLQNNYNACMVQAQRQQGWGGQGYGGGWDGGYGGWGDDDDYYRQQRRQRRAVSKQAECARWLYAIQQNGCVR